MLAALDPLGVIMTILGLGFLIFFHELGHFIACRLTGTRVEAFSVGFGPKLFGWRRGHTLYKISAIPLGGYVKMAAENPGDARSDAPDEFPNKSFLARLFIMSNGVIFNVILALLLYVWAFKAGVPFPKAQLGTVTHGRPGWSAGLQAGDIITHINGETIFGFDDLRTEVAFSDKGEVLKMTVDRGGQVVDIAVTPQYSDAIGMPVIEVGPSFQSRMLSVDPDSPLAEAGGKAGDTVLAIDGQAVVRVQDIQKFTNRAVGGATGDDIRVSLRVLRESGEESEFSVPVATAERPQIGIFPYAGNTVDQMPTGNPAAAWVLVGDTILSVNGVRPHRAG